MTRLKEFREDINFKGYPTKKNKKSRFRFPLNILFYCVIGLEHYKDLSVIAANYEDKFDIEL